MELEPALQNRLLGLVKRAELADLTKHANKLIKGSDLFRFSNGRKMTVKEVVKTVLEKYDDYEAESVIGCLVLPQLKR